VNDHPAIHKTIREGNAMSTEANIEIPGELHGLPQDTQGDARQGRRAAGKQESLGTVQHNMQSSKIHAIQAAGELKTAVEAKGRELLHVADELLHVADGKAAEIRSKAESAYGEARSQLKVFQKQSEEYVRENPLRSLCIALGAGFVIGIIARR
jgi:ElaB/YqjD/DUF883 family membrane-anchored ribosome-binding protein